MRSWAALKRDWGHDTEGFVESLYQEAHMKMSRPSPLAMPNT